MTKFQLVCGAVAIALVSSLSAIGPAGTAAAKPVDTAKIAAAIRADETAWGAAYAARDATKVAGYYSTDAISMFEQSPNTAGRAAILASLTKDMAVPDKAFAFSLTTVSVDVAASGDLAVTHGTYKVSFTDPKTKKPTSSSGNYVNLFKVQADGIWKIAMGIVASDIAPAPAPSQMASPMMAPKDKH